MASTEFRRSFAHGPREIEVVATIVLQGAQPIRSRARSPCSEAEKRKNIEGKALRNFLWVCLENVNECWTTSLLKPKDESLFLSRATRFFTPLCQSVGWLVGQSPFYFFGVFKLFELSQPTAPAFCSNALVIFSITAPAQPHVTDPAVFMYPASFR